MKWHLVEFYRPFPKRCDPSMAENGYNSHQCHEYIPSVPFLTWVIEVRVDLEYIQQSLLFQTPSYMFVEGQIRLNYSSIFTR